MEEAEIAYGAAMEMELTASKLGLNIRCKYIQEAIYEHTQAVGEQINEQV